MSVLSDVKIKTDSNLVQKAREVLKENYETNKIHAITMAIERTQYLQKMKEEIDQSIQKMENLIAELETADTLQKIKTIYNSIRETTYETMKTVKEYA